MSGFKTFSVNENLTSSDTNQYFAQQNVKIKSANETVTSSTVLQDDDDLLLTVSANTNYWVEGLLFVATGVSSTPDIKIGVNIPSGTFRWCTNGLGPTATATLDIVDKHSYTGGSGIGVGSIASSNTGVPFSGIARSGASGGNLKIQWAQNSSNATGTQVLARSILRVLRVFT